VNYDAKTLTELLEDALSKKRFLHSLNVADEAVNLAKKYGQDISNAYFAGLMHDCCKELSTEELRELAMNSNLCVDNAEASTRGLWDAIAGAAYVRDTLGVDDKDIINAIRFHTISRAYMTVFEEIIYIADMISKDRTYTDVEKFRKMAYEDLKLTMLECIKYSLIKVIGKCGYIPSYTFEAYHYYLNIMKK